jgi:hypothetical protein
VIGGGSRAGAGKCIGAAKFLATKFLQIFGGIYFGFSAGIPIFATRSKSRPSGSLKSGLRRVVGERMVR